MSDIHKQLMAPFKKIHWRMGATNKKRRERDTGDRNARATKGQPLAYVNARDVMKRLDEVVGPENWQCEYPYKGCCRIGIREIVFADKEWVDKQDLSTYSLLNHSWIWKSNGGAESKQDPEKGRYSDAFKRAAAVWGVGRYLYYLPSPWVPMDEYGKFTPPELPDWAKYREEK